MTASGWRKLALVAVVIWVVVLVRSRLHQSSHWNSRYSGDSGGSTYVGGGSSGSASSASDDEEAGESESGDADAGDAGGGGGDD
jgi:hypothetical protein